MDKATLQVYEREARRWELVRGSPPDALGRECRRLAGSGPVIDLGCGTGRYANQIGPPLVGADASMAMLAIAKTHGCPLVGADLEALPFADGAFTGAFARHSYLHIPKERVPAALREVRRVLRPGGLLLLSLIEGDYEGRSLPGDDFPGRFFAFWNAQKLGAELRSSGFLSVDITRAHRSDSETDLVATARR